MFSGKNIIIPQWLQMSEIPNETGTREKDNSKTENELLLLVFWSMIRRASSIIVYH